ncbi:MAG: ATP-binding cassette domain-containing protein [Saprospiraceae bacterium]
MIEISQLKKSYGKKEVLHGINATFQAGKVYGIIGENGAGKSTLFRCIAGLEDYTGDIKSPYSIIKNHLGLLPTNPLFMRYLTGSEYLRLLCIARDIDRTDFTQQNIFKLPLDQYADTYSTGMQKKLALTGILLQKNDLFILDEPFNGVDIHSNFMIIEIIKQLKNSGKTVLLASHIFATLRDTCDGLFWLQNGQLSAEIPPAEFDHMEQQMQEGKVNLQLEIFNL